jgi:hypothetical protein
MLPDAGVTATVGVTGFDVVPPPPWLPPPHAQIERIVAEKGTRKQNFANRFIQTPFDNSSEAAIFLEQGGAAEDVPKAQYSSALETLCS